MYRRIDLFNKLQLKGNSFHDILEKIQSMPLLTKTFKIAATVSVSTASAERSFSKLILIKTYLRNQMEQERLCHLGILSMNQDVPLNVERVVKEFSSAGGRSFSKYIF